MEWLNVFGLAFISAIMIPNIIFAIKRKDAFKNNDQNKTVEVIEQIGRYGCLGFMILNIPTIWLGWWSDEAFVIYLIVDTMLTALYCTIWILCWRKNSIFRTLSLSIIPSVMFLFSGVMCRSVPLVISSLLFMPAHIHISYKNTCRLEEKRSSSADKNKKRRGEHEAV